MRSTISDVSPSLPDIEKMKQRSRKRLQEEQTVYIAPRRRMKTKTGFFVSPVVSCSSGMAFNTIRANNYKSYEEADQLDPEVT